MDKSFLDITGFADVFSRFWRQKNPARLRRFAKKSDPFRKPASGFSCPKGCEGRYCMQSIPLAVLKRRAFEQLRNNPLGYCMQSIPLAVLKRIRIRSIAPVQYELHAIHTACGIETVPSPFLPKSFRHCMQSIPLAVLKPNSYATNCVKEAHCMQSIPLAVLKKDRFVRNP